MPAAIIAGVIEIVFSAVPESVPDVRGWLIDRAKEAGAAPCALAAIALAATEAAGNAVLHAFNGMGVGEITVSAGIVDRCRFRVVVADNGSGLRPRPDSPGLGLGLPLLSELAGEVEISTPPAGGTEVRMDFALAA
jgi:anti-sigma regulatory factor (Ser/Thr protein kinase)